MASTIRAIAYGNGKFVAGNDSGKMAYSSDGKAWTAVAYSEFGSISAIAYGNGTFVAGSGSKMAYSSDGVSWTAVLDSKISSDSIEAIAYGNGTWVAGSFLGNMVYSSDNGVTWTAVAGKPLGTMSGGVYRGVDAIAYGNGTWVAVSRDSANSEITATSANGITWTTVTDGTYGRVIAYDGSGKFVAGGSGGKIATSTNGTTWTAVTNSTFSQIDAIAYGNGKFVAGGWDPAAGSGMGGGRIATSSDGTTWTVVGDKILGTDEYGAGNWITAIAYGNGTWVVGGSGGKIAASTGL
jgi:hypothetical protein